MKLAELTSILDCPEVRGSLDCEVTGLTDDSRTIVPGMLFVAVRGLQRDGHQFVEQAMAGGAAAAVVEKKGRYGSSHEGSCVIQVKDTRKALSALAHQFYGRPSHKLGMIGVTGTNGKTTTTHLIKGILEAAGKKVGLLGTVHYHVGQEVLPASHTTPESIELHRLLARMIQAGAEYTVMEVSSHALAQERVADCAFDVGVFTNLTQDHLDFHVSLENYFEAKLKLFKGLGVKNPKSFPRMALVNREDPRADRVIASTQVPCWTYGHGKQTDLSAGNLRMSFEGIRFLARTPKGKFEVHSALTGGYNVSNILAAIGVALSQDVPIPLIQKGIREIRHVPGRFEKIEEGQDFLVIVDYAHTDDALQKLLLDVRKLQEARSAGGRILTVFGCGGDRDRGKRPKMGRVAAELSDLVILTSDNPRTEDPMVIIREIEKGIKRRSESQGRPTEYLVNPNRAEAIEKAIGLARGGDIVVIAGKGHEDYQMIGDRKLRFDDREVARESLRRLRAKG
jgi:UDP-N-acetylmuramoyl-L-alanyl-D-glutamate--2,6-diaminopimelate ligase